MIDSAELHGLSPEADAALRRSLVIFANELSQGIPPAQCANNLTKRILEAIAIGRLTDRRYN